MGRLEIIAAPPEVGNCFSASDNFLSFTWGCIGEANEALNLNLFDARVCVLIWLASVLVSQAKAIIHGRSYWTMELYQPWKQHLQSQIELFGMLVLKSPIVLVGVQEMVQGFFASPMRRYILTQMFQGRERRIIPRNLQITIGVRKKGFRRLTNLFSHCGVVGSWNRLQSWVGVSGYSRNWGKCNETTIGNMVWIPWEHMHSKPYFTHWKKPWMLVCIPNVNLPWENGNVLLSHDPLFDLAVL